MLTVITITVVNIILAVLMLKHEWHCMMRGFQKRAFTINLQGNGLLKMPTVKVDFNPEFWKPLVSFCADIAVTLTCSTLFFGSGLYAGMLSIITSNVLSFFVFLDRKSLFGK